MTMIRFVLLCAVVASGLCPSATAAVAAPGGFHFSRHDWEIACDNTRTCRAAGYHSEVDTGDGVDLGLSVLLTREAGPRTVVTAQLMLSAIDNDEIFASLPDPIPLVMRVNGRSLGQVPMRKNELLVTLTAAQVAAMLAVLPRSANIEWTAGKHRWRLSDKGAAAVLLKMDEFQGRVGTPGALVRKGSLPEDGVLPAVPKPVVAAQPFAAPLPRDAQWAKTPPAGLRKALIAATSKDDCYMLAEPEGTPEPLEIMRITSTHLLVSTPCWRGAYNAGTGYWVVRETPPFQPVLVTASGSDFTGSRISASHKSRGLGDCWSSSTWTWDGKAFVLSEAFTTGMCRFVAAGGPWQLYTHVSQEKP